MRACVRARLDACGWLACLARLARLDRLARNGSSLPPVAGLASCAGYQGCSFSFFSPSSLAFAIRLPSSILFRLPCRCCLCCCITSLIRWPLCRPPVAGHILLEHFSTALLCRPPVAGQSHCCHRLARLRRRIRRDRGDLHWHAERFVEPSQVAMSVAWARGDRCGNGGNLRCEPRRGQDLTRVSSGRSGTPLRRQL